MTEFPDRKGSRNANWRGGTTKHYLYDTYMDMLARCRRPKHQRYASYGGRGISVCDRWVESFWNFVEDVGERPDKHVLDRIDNDGNYEPSNVRWADYSVSAKNRRPFKRRTHCMAGHEYTPESAYTNKRTGKRTCRACRRNHAGQVRGPRGRYM